jgi:hypothetical protein
MQFFLNFFSSAAGVKMWLGKFVSFTEGSRQRHFYEIINERVFILCSFYSRLEYRRRLVLHGVTIADSDM